MNSRPEQYFQKTATDIVEPSESCAVQSSQSTSPHRDRSPLKQYVCAPLAVDYLVEVQLLLLTFSTGIQDAISFPDFHCFASNQTGNTVVLAVGLAGLGGDLFDMPNVGASLGCFLFGAIITGQIAHLVGTHGRGWLFLSHLTQTVMTFGAAMIQAFHKTDTGGPAALAAISLLAFASGAQVASMRPMRIPEITTAMATAAWIDLVVDSRLLALKNRSRNRRALFLIALVAGSFTGAFMHVKIGSSNSLIIAAAGKLLVTMTLLLNREQRPEACSAIA